MTTILRMQNPIWIWARTRVLTHPLTSTYIYRWLEEIIWVLFNRIRKMSGQIVNRENSFLQSLLFSDNTVSSTLFQFLFKVWWKLSSMKGRIDHLEQCDRPHKKNMYQLQQTATHQSSQQELQQQYLFFVRPHQSAQQQRLNIH